MSTTDANHTQALALARLCELHKLQNEMRAGTTLAALTSAERAVMKVQTECDEAHQNWRASMSGSHFDPVLTGQRGRYLRERQDELRGVIQRRDNSERENEAARAALALSQGREDSAQTLLVRSRIAMRRCEDDHQLSLAEEFGSRARRKR